jgi:uncharacterized integral membrane protein
MGEPRTGEPAPRPAESAQTAQTAQTTQTERTEPPRKPGRSRVGGTWVGLVLGAVVLILLLIFVLQNLKDVRVSFIGTDGSLPLGVALLLAAVAGALVVAVPGSARIVQLRRANRNARRALNRT